MDFRGYVRVFNQLAARSTRTPSIRLIVGTINLVEKIADLARRRGIPRPAPQSPSARLQLRRDSAKRGVRPGGGGAATRTS